MQGKDQAVGKQVHLPLTKAFEIALKNIRMRFSRSMVTAAGIFLGIAFLGSVIAQGAVNKAVAEEITKNEIIRQQWLVVLALLMSTIGITNSMLMAVTERFKEIGTMKCLGALDIFVVEMFILEGMLLGMIASFLGAVAGGGVMIIYAGLSLGWGAVGKVDFASLGLWLAGSVVLGSILTFIATIAPAYRAAKMPPAAALRVEI